MTYGGMTQPQKLMLRIIAKWGELPPDAEDQMDLQGAAFWSVYDALTKRGYICDGEITTEGRVAAFL